MQVSEADLRRVGKAYLSNLFDNQLSRTVIVCHPSKVNATRDSFKS